MKNKRIAHGEIIKKFKVKKEEQETFLEKCNRKEETEPTTINECDDNEINETFKKVVSGRKTENLDSIYKKKKNKNKNKKLKISDAKKKQIVASLRDEENFIPYQASDKHTEDGLAINTFEQQARNAEISVIQENQQAQYKPGQKKWDRIKKKMVSVDNPKAGKIRTESGAWIPKTYKTGRYDDWKEKNKVEEMVSQQMGDDCKF